MQTAYKQMYIIENSLRFFIKQRMTEYYVTDWYRTAPRIAKMAPLKKPLQDLHYHELIPFLRIYPCFTDVNTNQLVSDLRKLIPIRNLIAHHHLLSSQEQIILNNIYVDLKNFILYDK